MTNTNKVTRNPESKPQRVESDDLGKKTKFNGWEKVPGDTYGAYVTYVETLL